MKDPRLLGWCAAAAVASAPAVCAAAEAAPSLTDSGSIYNALWTLVIFMTLMAVLVPLAWRPILRAVRQREQHIATAIERTEANRRESGEILAETRAGLDSSREQARQIVQQAHAESERDRDELLAAARDRAAGMIRQADERIADARKAAVDDMVAFGADLATQAARTVIGRELAGPDHQRILAESLAEIRRRAPGGRA